MYSLTSHQINPTFARSSKEQEIFNFLIQQNTDDYYNLADFKKGLISNALIHQAISAKKMKSKIPIWAANPNIFYPPTLSLEQSSSQQTALFKASLFKGKSCIDLTGGMGIDSYFFAQHFEQVITVEKNIELANIALHNFALLNQFNISMAIGVDALDFIQQYSLGSDLIYIDPARRNKQGIKVAGFADCEPNIVPFLDKLFDISAHILIKGSPLLDIQAACHELKAVSNVYVVAINNECKELLFHLQKDHVGEANIEIVHFDKENESRLSFVPSDEKKAMSVFASPKKYLFEPNSAVLKAGAFKWIGQHYNLFKLHQHSHLYTSDHFVKAFPGRSFEVLNVMRVDKKSLHESLPDGKASLSLRNFPGTVEGLRKKLNIKDGGDAYIFASTAIDNQKVLILCKKLILA